MAAGDLVVADYQTEVRGLLLGPTTNYKVAGIDRLKAHKIRRNDQPNPAGHGTIPGVDFVDADTKVLTVSMGKGNGVTTPTAVLAMLEQLRTAWVQGDTIPLPYRLPGQNKRRRIGRTRDFEPDLSNLAAGFISVLCQFDATDPLEYDNDLSTGSTGLPVASGGLTFPATAPFSFGTTGSGGSITAVNSGNTGAPWVAQIVGPVTDPKIQSVTQDKLFSLIGDVPAGSTLTVDSAAHQVLLDGTGGRMFMLRPGYQWFDLAPGSNEIRFIATSGTGTLTLQWRSAWT